VKNHKPPVFLKPISFLTENQKIFYDKIEDDNNKVILAHGLAGCGKSFISIQKGLEFLLTRGNTYKKMYVIQPTVDVGNEDKLGYLPGNLDQKASEYFESTEYIVRKILPPEEANKLMEVGKLKFEVVNFLRGMNLEDCYVIIDEAQNLSPLQLKTICTRISDTTKLIIQGDLSQCDKFKSSYQKSGFYDIWHRFSDVCGVDRIQFGRDDCIRSGIVKRILETYGREQFVNLHMVV